MKSKRPIVNICKQFTFDAAHYLPAVGDEHPCRKLHGHTYTVEVELRGAVDSDLGWLVDYRDIKKIVKPLIKQLDHCCLNDVAGLNFTTAEDIAVWFWERVKPDLEQLHRITIKETQSSRCDFYGEFID